MRLQRPQTFLAIATSITFVSGCAFEAGASEETTEGAINAGNDDLNLGTDAGDRFHPTSIRSRLFAGNNVVQGTGALGGIDRADCFGFDATIGTRIEASGMVLGGSVTSLMLHIRAPNRWSGSGTGIAQAPALIGTVATVTGSYDKAAGEWEVCLSSLSSADAAYSVSVRVYPPGGDFGLGGDAGDRYSPSSVRPLLAATNVAFGTGELSSGDSEDCYAFDAAVGKRISASGMILSGQADSLRLDIRSPTLLGGSATVMLPAPVLLGIATDVSGSNSHPAGQWQVCVSSASGQTAAYDLRIRIL